MKWDKFFCIYGLCLWVFNTMVVVASYWHTEAGAFVLPIFLLLLPPWIRLIQRQKSDGADISSCPKFLQILGRVSYAYTGLNFFLCLFLLQGGKADIIDGVLGLYSHGELILEVTEAEYHYYTLVQTRFFTGHLMAFAGMAAVALTSEYNKNKL